MSVAQVMQLLALASTIAGMIERGAVSFARLREILAAEGATPSELAALDADLSARIADREAGK